MPRNSSGTYSLPAGNPVVTATVISSTWANTTLSDLRTAMTDSLDRSGRGGMLAQLALFAGTAGAPGLSWTTEPTSGLYRAGAGDFRWSVSGVDVFSITGTVQTITGTVPRLRFYETDASLNNKSSDIAVNGENLVFRLTNDADNAAANWLAVNRALNVATVVTLTANSFVVAGTSTFTPTSTNLGGIFNGGGTVAGNIESSDAARASRWTFGRDNVTTGNWVLAFNGAERYNMTSAGVNTFANSVTINKASGFNVFTVANQDAAAGAGSAVYVTNSAGNFFRNLFSNTANVTAYTTGGPTGSAAYVYTTGSDPISIGTAGVERMRIDATGIVTYGGIEVGYRGMPNRQLATTGNIVQTDNGKAVLLTSATFTATLTALTTDTIVTLMCTDTASKTITVSTGSLFWLNGTGAPATGNRTLAIGGIATVWQQTTGAWYIWGMGIT